MRSFTTFLVEELQEFIIEAKIIDLVNTDYPSIAPLEQYINLLVQELLVVQENEDGGWSKEHFDFWNFKVKPFISAIKDSAYKQIEILHELEYKKHKLQTYATTNTGLFDEINTTINKLFRNIKPFMLFILGLRVFYDKNFFFHPENDTIQISAQQFAQQYFNNPTDELYVREIKQYAVTPQTVTKNEMGIPWSSIYKALYLLHNTKTTEEKPITISLVLNVWHDNGSIFGIDKEGENIWFAPFTFEQLDALSNINPKRWDHEIRREEF